MLAVQKSFLNLLMQAIKFLKKHQIKQHSTFIDKGESYFQNLEKQIIAVLPDQMVLASYRLSYKISKAGKNHTIGEDLYKQQLLTLFLLFWMIFSANTVQRRRKTISTHLKDEVIRKILLSSTFAMQLNESTDVANLAELLVYVRYAHGTFIE
jgi:hypothetical protein